MEFHFAWYKLIKTSVCFLFCQGAFSPASPFMAVVAQTALALHSTNSARETTQQILSEPVSVEAKEKFADL